MIQLGGCASTTVCGLRFPNDLDALVQHQQEEILKKREVTGTNAKWGATSYPARFQKRLWHFRGSWYNFEVQQRPIAAYRQTLACSDDPWKVLSYTLQSFALSCSLPCSQHAFSKSGLERILWITATSKNTRYEIKLHLFKPDMVLSTD